MWYIYFLKLSNKTIYVGLTQDLNIRLKSHNSGNVASTSKHLSAELVSFVAVQSKDKAMALEKYFKSGTGKALAIKRFF